MPSPLATNAPSKNFLMTLGSGAGSEPAVSSSGRNPIRSGSTHTGATHAAETPLEERDRDHDLERDSNGDAFALVMASVAGNVAAHQRPKPSTVADESPSAEIAVTDPPQATGSAMQSGEMTARARPADFEAPAALVRSKSMAAAATTTAVEATDAASTAQAPTAPGATTVIDLSGTGDVAPSAEIAMGEADRIPEPTTNNAASNEEGAQAFDVKAAPSMPVDSASVMELPGVSERTVVSTAADEPGVNAASEALAAQAAALRVSSEAAAAGLSGRLGLVTLAVGSSGPTSTTTMTPQTPARVTEPVQTRPDRDTNANVTGSEAPMFAASVPTNSAINSTASNITASNIPTVNIPTVNISTVNTSTADEPLTAIGPTTITTASAPLASSAPDVVPTGVDPSSSAGLPKEGTPGSPSSSGDSSVLTAPATGPTGDANVQDPAGPGNVSDGEATEGRGVTSGGPKAGPVSPTDQRSGSGQQTETAVATIGHTTQQTPPTTTTVPTVATSELSSAVRPTTQLVGRSTGSSMGTTETETTDGESSLDEGSSTTLRTLADPASQSIVSSRSSTSAPSNDAQSALAQPGIGAQSDALAGTAPTVARSTRSTTPGGDDKPSNVVSVDGMHRTGSAAAPTPAHSLTSTAVDVATTGASSAGTPSDVADQVATNIRRYAGLNGEHHMTLELNPHGLGAVNIDLTVDGANVHLRMTTEHASTGELLRSALDGLRSSLSEGGFASSSFDVSHQAGRQPGSEQSRQQSQPNGNERRSPAGSPSVGTQRLDPRSRLATLGAGSPSAGQSRLDLQL